HVVSPNNVAVLDASTGPELTLTTCNPRYSAATRLVVMATMTAATLTTPPTVPTSAPASTPASTTPVTVPKNLGGAVGETSGGIGGVSTRGQVGLALLGGGLTLA